MSHAPPDEAFLLLSSHDVMMGQGRQLQDDTLPTGLELVKNIFLILLSGIAIVLGMAILAYCICLLVDKCVHGCCCSCCRSGGGDALSNNNNSNNGGGGNMTNGTGTTANSVVRKAGLVGLRPNERRRILEHIFEKTTSTYHAKDYDQNNDMNNTTGPTTQSETASNVETPPNPTPAPTPQQQNQQEPAKTNGATAVTTTGIENTSNSNSVVTGTKNDAIIMTNVDHEHSCSICLCPYQENCVILTGKSCRHVFHYKCAMDWLDRHENDHCPYCRKEMISADELRQTAIQLLGQERVVEIGMWQGQRNDYYNSTRTIAATTTTTSSSSSSTTPAAAPVRAGMTTATSNTTFTEGDIEMGQASLVASTDEEGGGANDVSGDDSSAEIRV